MFRIGIDYVGTSAGAVIKDKEGKIFMAQRGFKARDDVGKWEFPHGYILRDTGKMFSGNGVELLETHDNAPERHVSIAVNDDRCVPHQRCVLVFPGYGDFNGGIGGFVPPRELYT
jgi:hypothetical protein